MTEFNADDNLEGSSFNNAKLRDARFHRVDLEGARFRASNVSGMVSEFLATVTAADLSSRRPNPNAPDFDETVLSCLHTILEEEWEHQRYAVRDLDRITVDQHSSTAEV